MNHSFYPTINIGDIITRRKLLGIIEHYGVVVGYDMVLHNTPGRGEHTATIAAFAGGQPVKVKPTGADPSIVSARSQEILANPKRYHPFRRNCEHTALEATRGEAKSPTATASLLVFVVAVFAFMGAAVFLRKRGR